MIATIHQSYFIPWLGYFSKLTYSDIFVVLDDVLFRKRHFFDRTQIVNMHGEIRWINLPVGQNYGISCNKVFVKQPDFEYVDKLIRTIELSYSKARHFDKEWKYLKPAIETPMRKSTNLVDVNISLIRNLFDYLEIRLPTIYRSRELIDICEDPTKRTFRCRKNMFSIRYKKIVGWWW